MQISDYFELTNSAEMRIPEGKRFCIYAIAAVTPLLPAKQRQLPAGDWPEKDSLVCCPDPEERLFMRIEQTRKVTLKSEELT